MAQKLIMEENIELIAAAVMGFIQLYSYNNELGKY